MKRSILGLFTIASLGFATSNVNAQSFTTASDTVYLTYTGNQNIEMHNDITVGNSAVNLKWHVVPGATTTTLITDTSWCSSSAFSVCDNYNCYINTAYTYITNGGDFVSPTPYAANQTGLFKAGFNLANAVTNGTRYVTINLEDENTGYNKDIVFVVSKWATSTPNVTRNSDNIVLYPNPVRDEVNVVFNELNVKNIAVYNVIGKTMVVYRTAGNSAKMDLSKFPAGVYFLRMSDANGDIVATKRFTKQ